MADRITIDISILQGVFGDLGKLQAQLAGLTGGVAAVDSAASQAFGGVAQSVRGAQGAVAGLENGIDVGMRNAVADIMAPVAKTQELETKLRRLGEQVRTSKSVGEIVKLKKEIAATQRELDGVNPGAMETKVGGAVGRMRSMFGGLIAPLAGAMAVGGVMAFGNSLVHAAGDAQAFGVSMEVMLKSKERADALSAQVTEFAGSTPFELGELRDATTKLLAYQVAAEDIVPTLEGLGNIAAGVGREKLPQLMTAFGQVKAAGKLTGGELRQFTEAGVPLLDELAKVMGKTTMEMAGNIAKMDVPFETVQQALTNLSTGTGQFANLMERQSATIGGMTSNMSDSWNKFKEDMGMAFAPQIMGGIDMLRGGIDMLRVAFEWVITNGDTIISVTKGVGIAVGIYTAALLINNASLIANNALQAVAAIRMGVVGGFMTLVTAGTNLWTAAQWALNVALTANPIGIVIAAVAALVGAVIYAWNNFAEFRAFLFSLWEAVKSVFTSIGDYIGTIFSAIADAAVGVGKVLKGAFTLDMGLIKEGMDQHAKGMTDLFSNILAAPEVAEQAAIRAAQAGVAGWKDGLASFQADQDKEQSAAIAGPGVSGKTFAPDNVGAAGLVGGVAPGATTGGKATGDGVTVGGSGGSGRSITMDIKITNNFTMPKDGNMGARQAAEQVVAQMVAKFNDAQYAAG